MRKAFVAAVLCVLLIICLWMLQTQPAQLQQEPKSALTVLVTSVDGQQHFVQEKVFGVVEKSFDQFVYARNIGHIRWYKKLGDSVAKDDLIATISNEVYDRQYKVLQEQQKVIKDQLNELQLKKAQWDQYQNQPIWQKVISSEFYQQTPPFEQWEWMTTILSHGDAQLRFQINQLNAMNQTLVIKAPKDGKIVSVYSQDGQLVYIGDPLVEIESKGAKIIRVFIPQSGDGMPESWRFVLSDGLDEPLPFVNTIVDDEGIQRWQYQLPEDIYFNSGEILPLFRQSTHSVFGFRLPESALYAGQYVYKVKDNHLLKIAVDVVAEDEDFNDNQFVIINASELADGDIVVSEQLNSVNEGIEVHVSFEK